MSGESGLKPALMHLISIFSTHLRVTGSKQLKSTAASLSSACSYFSWTFTILQSVDSGDATQGSRVFSGNENPSCAAGAAFMTAITSPPPAEVPYCKTLNPHHRQIKRCVVWMGTDSQWMSVYPNFLFPSLAPPLLVYLFWSNEGNKLCCCWCCWLLWLLSSVCKESVSALRTHGRRETLSITSTAVVRKKKKKSDIVTICGWTLCFQYFMFLLIMLMQIM